MVSLGVLVVTGLDGVGGGVGGLVTGFQAGLVVAGFVTNLVYGLWVGLTVVLGADFGVATADGNGGLTGRLVPPMSGIRLVMPPLPLIKEVFPLNTPYGSDGSTITLGIAGGKDEEGGMSLFIFVNVMRWILCRVRQAKVHWFHRIQSNANFTESNN